MKYFPCNAPLSATHNTHTNTHTHTLTHILSQRTTDRTVTRGGTHESGGVVVLHGLGVAKRLQHRVRLQYLLLHALHLLALAGDGGDVLHDELGALSLARAGLATDDDALIDALRDEAVVRILGHGKDLPAPV